MYSIETIKKMNSTAEDKAKKSGCAFGRKDCVACKGYGAYPVKMGEYDNGESYYKEFPCDRCS